MERSERVRLENIQANLRRQLESIQRLLANAEPPRRLGNRDRTARAQRICEDVKKRGGRVSKEVLRKICEHHGLPFHTVGALFVADYLRKAPKGTVTLGKRAAKRRRG